MNTRYFTGKLTTLAALATFFFIAAQVQAGIAVAPGSIVGGSANGTLYAVDVPFIGDPPSTTFPSGTDWTDDADDGFKFVRNINYNDKTQVSPWEPNGTALADAQSYSISAGSQSITNPDVSWTFSLNQGSIITDVYATWVGLGNIGRRILWGYTEGVQTSTNSVQQLGGGPTGDLQLSWVDSDSTSHTGNFQRIFSGPIIVGADDSFSIVATENWNEGWIDAVVVDVLSPTYSYWESGVAGTWDGASTNWNSAPDGTGTSAAWTPGEAAVFAAGTTGTGTYTVTVSGQQDVSGLFFEEGTVTIEGDGLRLTALSVASVADTLTATVNSNISEDTSSRGLLKLGAGTLVLGGDNSYSGGTTISQGTVQVGSSTALGTGDVTNNGALILSSSGAMTINNDISGSGSVTQSGSGTTVLNGTNTYTGATLVSNGTLEVGTTGAISGTSGVTVSGGAEFINNSSNPITQVVTVTDGTLGGTGAFGDLDVGTGSLTIGSGIAEIALSDTSTVTIGNGAVINWQFLNSGSHDKITNVNALMDLAGAAGGVVTINIEGLTGYSVSKGQAFTLFEGTVNQAEFDAVAEWRLEGSLAGYWSIAPSGSLTLTSTIPEPSTMVLAGLGLAGLTLRRRRRK